MAASPCSFRQQTIYMRRVAVTSISECGTWLLWHRLRIVRITHRYLCIVPGKFDEAQFFADETDYRPEQWSAVSYFTRWIIRQHVDTGEPGATTPEPSRVGLCRYRYTCQRQRMLDPRGDVVVVIESAPTFIMKQSERRYHQKSPTTDLSW